MNTNAVPYNLNSPSEKAKQLGLKSLKQVSELTGTSQQTLINWAKSGGTNSDKTDLFNIVLLGCVVALNEQR
tara:strand:- start:5218 stop:5433 length:216 start_codon:yes stop_codon:yes gene_type:complete